MRKKDSICADCKIFSLGAYLKNYKNYKKDIDKVSVHFWYSSKHNMGMAFDGPTWQSLRNCSQMFCSYDDYNWDWSMLQVSMKCLAAKMRVIVAKSPRVLHIGDCGVHTHRCAAANAAEAASLLFNKHHSLFFPENLQVAEVSKRMLKPSKPNGGWGDIRDHKLCLLNTHPTDREIDDDFASLQIQ